MYVTAQCNLRGVSTRSIYCDILTCPRGSIFWGSSPSTLKVGSHVVWKPRRRCRSTVIKLLRTWNMESDHIYSKYYSTLYPLKTKRRRVLVSYAQPCRKRQYGKPWKAGDGTSESKRLSLLRTRQMETQYEEEKKTNPTGYEGQGGMP